MLDKLSIIIPTLNEAEHIEQYLIRLQALRRLGHEVIVVDGGSVDLTASIAVPLSDHVLHTQCSRSIQMNVGALKASGDILVFLHADTILPENIIELFSKYNYLKNKWGRFDIKLSGRNILFRIIETCMNFRSRMTGIATGDQVIFIGQYLFDKANGFPEIPLMEDIAISKSLMRFSKPICISQHVISSSRRWEKNGIIRTVLKMWLLRFLYYFNYDTKRLAKLYG